MKRQVVCLVCGSEFTADRVTQKYCSPACRRYAHRHGMNDHKHSSRKKEALRTFRCLKCRKKVRVTERGDRRTKFCSSHCERLYWKHSRHVAPAVIRRSFTCRNCGRLVEVTEARDRRTVFCGTTCRIRWLSRFRSVPKERDRQGGASPDGRRSMAKFMIRAPTGRTGHGETGTAESPPFPAADET